MRYFLQPCEEPFERGRWDLMDSDTGQRVATTSRGLPDALRLVRVMNVHFNDFCRSSPAGEQESLHGYPTTSEEPVPLFA